MLKKLFTALILLVLTVEIASAVEHKNPIVDMETTLGTIKIELFAKEAPLSVHNFLNYVQSNFYSGTIFHRVIPGFMAQGGGFDKERKEKQTNPPIKNEASNGLKNDRGTVAMARTNFPDSATSQFFINVVNNDMLNRPNPDGNGYAVFGKVVKGIEVVDKIISSKTRNVNMIFQNMPIEPIIIKSIKIAK